MTLAHRKDQAPANQQDEGEGIRPNDLRPPFLVLLQDDGERGDAGWWYRTDTGEQQSAPQVIPLRLWQTRRKWPAGEYRRDRKAECWSTNGREAAPGSAYAGRECKSCQFFRADIFKMTDDEDSKGGACAPTYAAIVLDADTFEPMLLNLGSKTMYRLASSLETSMRVARVELSAALFKGDKGQWYSPKAKRVAKLEQDDADQVAELYQRFYGARIDTVQTETEPDDSGEEEAAESEPESEPEQAQPVEATATVVEEQPAGQQAEQPIQQEQQVSYANAGTLPF